MKKLIAMAVLLALNVSAVTTQDVLDLMAQREKEDRATRVCGIKIEESQTTISIRSIWRGTSTIKLVLEGQWIIEQGTEFRTEYVDGVLYALFDGNKAKVIAITEEK